MSKKNKHIEIAAILLYLSLLSAVIKTLINLVSIGNLSSIQSEILSTLTSLAFSVFLIFYIQKGKNWARFTFLFLATVSFVISLFFIKSYFFYSTALGSLAVVQNLLNITVIYFLFNAKVSDYFKEASQRINSSENVSREKSR